MDKRRDALAGAAKLELEIREIAQRIGGGAVCTMGGVVTKPGIVTSVVETAECLLDQRHLDAAQLAEMLSNAEARLEALRARGEHRGRVGADLEDRADPVRRRADRARRRGRSARSRARRTACRAARCTTRPRSSRAGIPTVMLFVQSLRGLSHTKLEDTKEEHLELSVRALDAPRRRRRSHGSRRVSTDDAELRRHRHARPALAADARADAARRAPRLRVRLDVRLAHPLAGVATRSCRSPPTKTETIKLGHCVTNPGIRDPTITASCYATLQDISERPHGDGHRPRRLVAARRRPQAGAGSPSSRRRCG